MSNIGYVIEVTSYALIIIAGVGMAGAYLRSNRAKNVIDLQVEEIAVMKETNNRLQQERKEFLHEREDNLKRIGALEKEIETLKELISQAPQINSLTKEILNQHQEVITKLSDIATLLVNQNKPKARR